MTREEKEKMDKKLREESTSAVQLFYLTRQIVQDEKIPVTHQEVEKEAVAIYNSYPKKSGNSGEVPREMYALALSKIIMAKAQDYILKKA